MDAYKNNGEPFHAQVWKRPRICELETKKQSAKSRKGLCCPFLEEDKNTLSRRTVSVHMRTKPWVSATVHGFIWSAFLTSAHLIPPTLCCFLGELWAVALLFIPRVKQISFLGTGQAADGEL